jgi:hypothetical protein
LIARLQLLESREGELEFSGLQGLQHLFRHGGIERITSEAHTLLGRQTFAAQPVALIAGIKAVDQTPSYQSQEDQDTLTNPPLPR